jgi:hypothetical protein
MKSFLCYNKTQGDDTMFKRIRTSLTKPPLTIFFMQDSWGKVLRHLFLLPLLLLLPLVLQYTVNQGMSPERFLRLQGAMINEFSEQEAVIHEGVLKEEQTVTAYFDYFAIMMGESTPQISNVSIVFKDDHLVMYIYQAELTRMSYQSLDIEQFDFKTATQADFTRLSSAIQTLIESQSVMLFIDLNLVYMTTLVDYTLIVLLMSLLMMIFVMNTPLTFKYRFKISVYLATVYLVVELILILFNARALSFLSIFVTYIYHLWAYRSMKIMPVEV